MLRSFEGKQRILDIGCGTGRDLAFLRRKGKDAYGIEASHEMLAVAKATCEQAGLSTEGRIFQAALPEIGLFQDAEFDGILCSAVLMHLPEECLFDSVYAIRRLLRSGGVLRVSIPSERDDIDPKTHRDRDGRLFADLPPAKLQLLLERIGFSMRQQESVPDSLGRTGIRWAVMEFTKLDETGDRPLHLVESILNRDKKDATYKLALFRALAEIAQTQCHLAAYLPDGKVKIPLSAVAEKWILYYWPIFESECFIPQRTNECKGGSLGVAIRKPLDALIQHFHGSGGLTGFYCDWKSGRLSKDGQLLFRTALTKFQSTIHTMPAKYAGGGHYSVFQYDRIDRSLVMNVALWRELCLMGSWIRDATILRWAELSEGFAKHAVKASQVIDRLLLAPDQGRNVADAQKYFRTLSSRPCVWSREPLAQGAFEVDHAMPFSYWRNNDLWNLFPADPKINASKSDNLPTYRQLQSSREVVIDYWQGLDQTLGERFAREAQTLLGREAFVPGNWKNLLFSRFVEAFETTAAQRGAERWEVSGLHATGVATEFIRPAPSPVRYAEAEELMIVREDARTPTPADTERIIIPFPELGQGAFKTHLPIIGSLAAGAAFHGIQTGSLTDLEDLDWVEVPSRLAKEKRFVVRVAGDSMEPTFQIGDLLVFEYHRSPRKDREIVIANLPEFGPDHSGTEAIKRLGQDDDDWIFMSDNPAYVPFRVEKAESSHPILGTFVATLGATQSGVNDGR